MVSDYLIDQDERDYEEAMQRCLIREAAVHVINGMDRASAIGHVKEIGDLRSAAEESENVVRDEDGNVESYLESKLEPPSEEGIKQSQIEAIYRELCDKEGICPEG